MDLNELKVAKKVVGIKQASKALEKGTATIIVIASDADEKVVKPLVDLSQEKAVAVYEVESMQELGKLCGIQVGAAAIAVVNA